MPFSALQQRIGRQKQVAQVMRTVPVVFVVYDILERDGVDIRTAPLSERRDALQQARDRRRAARCRRRSTSSPSRGTSSRALRLESRERGVEGFILKRRDSRVRRRTPQGRLVEVEDRSADGRRRAHLRAAGQRPARQPAHRLHLRRLGRGDARARGEGLLRACRTPRSRSSTNGSGGTRCERHGPVRAVEPVQVFELGFEAIAPSSRHKSGIAVRFPRMLRWRKDKPAAEADTLESLRKLIDRIRARFLRSGPAGLQDANAIWVVAFTLFAGSAVLPAREPVAASNPISSFFSRAEQPLHQYRAFRRMHTDQR